MTTTKTLIEQATLTEDERSDANDCHSLNETCLVDQCPNCEKGLATAARDKALWAVVDWLHSLYDWVGIKHIASPGSILAGELTAASIERPAVV